jgi:hypothetical protein
MVWERLLVAPDSVLLLDDDDQVAERYPELGLHERLRRASVPMPAGPGSLELLVAAAAEQVVLRDGDGRQPLGQEASDLVLAWYREAIDTAQPERN